MKLVYNVFLFYRHLYTLHHRYKLVKEALRERRYFLNTAPHLSNWLPIMVPLQKWWQAPYFWAGTKFYDYLAGSEGIESSYFLTKSKALESFPMLRKDNVIGAMVYYGMDLSIAPSRSFEKSLADLLITYFRI